MAVVTRLTDLVRNRIGPDAKKRRKAAKREAKRQRFERGSEWEKDSEFATRQYPSYDAYLKHQASKLDKIAHRLNRNRAEELVEFRERFELCDQLKEARSVLCLGARLGAEVEALHALGHFAVGLDLNPGADNPYVLPGDFHAIVFPDGSVTVTCKKTSRSASKPVRRVVQHQNPSGRHVRRSHYGLLS